MAKRVNPAVDKIIVPEHGVSRDGQPLSYNRSPASDLSPWVARLYATVVDAPDDYRLSCGLFNDASTFRFQLKGLWTADTLDGIKSLGRSALYFGPQTRRMPVSVTGGFISIGFSLRPGAGYALMQVKNAQFADRMVTCEDLSLPGEAVLQALEKESKPEEWLHTLEGMIRGIVDRYGGKEPDPITRRFEMAAYADPRINIADFARECGVDKRTVERIVSRDFGMSPKQVLRRTRALDMASHLRGVADDAEADELALRYYDQSHLIREFSELFGMSPSQFVSTPQPILTLALESRQAWRLELLKRLEPGAPRPWE